MSGLASFFLLCAATALIAGGLAWALNTHDPRPAVPCTSGASSIDADGRTFTTWQPEGCVHK